MPACAATSSGLALQALRQCADGLPARRASAASERAPGAGVFLAGAGKRLACLAQFVVAGTQGVFSLGQGIGSLLAFASASDMAFISLVRRASNCFGRSARPASSSRSASARASSSSIWPVGAFGTLRSTASSRRQWLQGAGHGPWLHAPDHHVRRAPRSRRRAADPRLPARSASSSSAPVVAGRPACSAFDLLNASRASVSCASMRLAVSSSTDAWRIRSPMARSCSLSALRAMSTAAVASRHA